MQSKKGKKARPKRWRSSRKTGYRIRGSAIRNNLIAIGMIIIISVMLIGCDKPDVSLGTTCKTINYVQMSHKDTKPTQEQNAANNGSLRELGCPFKTLYSSLP